MITLYGVYRSRASRPPRLLRELAWPYLHVPVIQSDRLRDPFAADAPLDTAAPAYLTISPLGQVPVINDDGLILPESLASRPTLPVEVADGLARNRLPRLP